MTQTQSDNTLLSTSGVDLGVGGFKITVKKWVSFRG